MGGQTGQVNSKRDEMTFKRGKLLLYPAFTLTLTTCEQLLLMCQPKEMRMMHSPPPSSPSKAIQSSHHHSIWLLEGNPRQDRTHNPIQVAYLPSSNAICACAVRCCAFFVQPSPPLYLCSRQACPGGHHQLHRLTVPGQVLALPTSSSSSTVPGSQPAPSWTITT